MNTSSITQPWRTIQKLTLNILKNYILSVLELDSGYTLKYRPSPSGVLSAKGLYLIVYPSSCPNTKTVYPEFSHNMDSKTLKKTYIFIIIYP